MAQQYVSSSSEYHSYASSSANNVGSGDFTICAWIYIDTDTANQRFFCKGNSSGGTGGGVRYEVHTRAVGPNFEFVIDDNTTKVAALWTGSTTGTWYPMIFERDSGTDLRIFEGATQRNTAGSDGAGNIDVSLSLLLGAGRGSGDTIVQHSDCTMADFAIIKRLLTSGEKTAFEKGYSPLFFNPTFYVPGIRSAVDSITGSSPTVGGTPSVHEHVSTMYPSPPPLLSIDIGAGGGGGSGGSILQRSRDIPGMRHW